MVIKCLVHDGVRDVVHMVLSVDADDVFKCVRRAEESFVDEECIALVVNASLQRVKEIGDIKIEDIKIWGFYCEDVMNFNFFILNQWRSLIRHTMYDSLGTNDRK